MKLTIHMYCPNVATAVKSVEGGADVGVTMPDATGAVYVACKNLAVQREITQYVFTRIGITAELLPGFGDIRVICYFWPVNFTDYHIVNGKVGQWIPHILPGLMVSTFFVRQRSDKLVVVRSKSNFAAGVGTIRDFGVLDEIGMISHGAQLLMPHKTPSSFVDGVGYVNKPNGIALVHKIGQIEVVMGRLRERYGVEVIRDDSLG